ncbi:MAG: CHASE domain-containing protein [Sedimentisphaerales bacterium]|nr:CHASE domain-containing protein [Sedimentisphaerales bacterium]
MNPQREYSGQSKNNARYNMVWMVIAVGLLVTIGAFIVLLLSEERYIKRDFFNVADKYRDAVHQALTDRLLKLSEFQAFYCSSSSVERDEFTSYAQFQIEHTPGIQAFWWIPKVSAHRRDEFEINARCDGLEAFQIWQPDEKGHRITTSYKQTYYPVFYLAPYGGNESFAGYDLSSSALLEELLYRARDTGHIVAVDAATLTSEGAKAVDDTLLCLAPVYSLGKVSFTVSGRRDNIQGFIAGMFSLSDILHPPIFSKERFDVHVQVWNHMKTCSTLLFSNTQDDSMFTRTKSASRRRWQYEKIIDLGILRWKIRCMGRPVSFMSTVPMSGIGILLGGALLTAFLAMYIACRTDKIRKLVDERTAELQNEIAERKQVENDLRERELRFRSIFDTSTDGIIIFNLEGIIVAANPAAHKLYGYAVGEMEGLSVKDFVHPDYFYLLNNFKKQMQTTGQFHAESVDVRKDGTPFNIEVSASLFTYMNESYVMAMVRDITERKKAEEQLKETHQRLVEAAHKAGMGEVATDILHNVGNVLNSINISANAIREILLTSKTKNLKKIIHLITEHADEIGTFLTEDEKGKHIPTYLSEVAKFMEKEQADITEKIHTLTRNLEHVKQIIQSQQKYAKAVGIEVLTNIREIIDDAIQINQEGLTRHGVTLQLEVSELPNIYIDKQHVLQILVNLISNGKYAVSKSQKKKKILIVRSYKLGKDKLRIEVEDNGIGISKQNMTKIFQHGFTTKEKGHGFGLHSGFLAAQEMGGSLTVHSDGLEQGAMFILELPLRQEKVTNAPDPQQKLT